MIPRKAKRDANEREIVAALEQCGATVYRLDVPCDLLIGFRGRTYLGEVKTKNGKLTKHQKEFAEVWRGQVPHIFRTPDDVVEWVNNPGKRTGLL